MSSQPVLVTPPSTLKTRIYGTRPSRDLALGGLSPRSRWVAGRWGRAAGVRSVSRVPTTLRSGVPDNSHPRRDPVVNTRKIASLAAAGLAAAAIATAGCASAATSASAAATAPAAKTIKGATHIMVYSINSDGPHFQAI